MKLGFERLIDNVKANTVLDMGCGGLEGENTSTYLIEKYGEEAITGVCKDCDAIVAFSKKYPKLDLKCRDFLMLEGTWDLVVYDPNIENSLNGWSEAGLGYLRSLTKKNLVAYVMRTDNYGDGTTPELIRQHRQMWWGTFSKRDIIKKLESLRGWKLVGFEEDDRRDFIVWVNLEKI